MSKTRLLAVICLLLFFSITASANDPIITTPIAFTLESTQSLFHTGTVFDGDPHYVSNAQVGIRDSGGVFRVIQNVEGNNVILQYDWSPDYSLLFVSAGDNLINFYNQAGQLVNQYQVANPRDISWSPDSQFILFSNRQTDQSRLTIKGYNPHTSQTFVVIEDSGTDTYDLNAQLSPDGRLIVFEHEEWGTNCYLVSAPFIPERLPYPHIDFHNDLFNDTVYNLHSISTSGCYGKRQVWSPDSQEVINYRNQAGGLEVYNFYQGTTQTYAAVFNDCNYVSFTPLRNTILCNGWNNLSFTSIADYPAHIYPPIALFDYQEDFILNSYPHISPDGTLFIIPGYYRGDSKATFYLGTVDGNYHWMLDLPDNIFSIQNPGITNISW